MSEEIKQDNLVLKESTNGEKLNIGRFSNIYSKMVEDLLECRIKNT